VHKGSTQTNKRLKKGFKFKRSKKMSVPWSGTPESPVCHRTVSGAPGPYNSKLATLGFLWACSAIIHRTVRCAIGLFGAPAKQRLLGATVDCKSAGQSYSVQTICSKSEQSPEAHRTVNSAYPVRHRTVRCH
jgi:hypothetical protein